MPESIDAEREREPHPFWLVLVACALIAAVLGIFVLGRSMDSDQRVIGNPFRIGGPDRITSLSKILDEPAEAALLGRHVALRGVRVQALAGDYVFWIGPRQSRRLPVVSRGELMARQPEERIELQPGDVVNVFGILRQSTEALLEADVLLSDEQRQRLAGTRVVLVATRVQPAG